MASGAFNAELVPVNTPEGNLVVDELPRPETTLEGLAKLKPVEITVALSLIISFRILSGRGVVVIHACGLSPRRRPNIA